MEGRDPEAKKRRKIEGGFGLAGYNAPDDVWYAHEKAKMLTTSGSYEDEQAHIEGGHEQRLIGGMEEAAQDEGGIFSSSTLAALKGRTFTTATANVAPSGPLVGYGSDDSD